MDWIILARYEMENRREARSKGLPTPVLDLIDNVTALLAHPDEWQRISMLEFRHQSGINLHLKRVPHDSEFNPGALSTMVALWFDDMPPFRVQFEKPPLNEFFQAHQIKDAKTSFEKVAALAAMSS